LDKSNREGRVHGKRRFVHAEPRWIQRETGNKKQTRESKGKRKRRKEYSFCHVTKDPTEEMIGGSRNQTSC